MYIKSIELLGFKTFAEKTLIEFGRGVSSIIGPNGCGKSNIVDALKWALGEQSVKSLRGGEMSDIIFNGNRHRRPSAFSEVSVVINNEDKTLPADVVEVSVKRRLTRTGESEYFLNGQQCRLKDIRELLMDTGVGAKNNTVIEQEHLTRLLQASSKERKALIEEAAGISRFRSQRQETSQRLGRVKENLDRLNDIIAEVEKQKRSVANQAAKARRFEALQTELRRMRLDLATMELHGWIARRAGFEKERDRLQAQIVELTRREEQGRAEARGVDEAEQRAEAEMQRMQGEQEVFFRALAEAEGTVQRGRQRMEELREEVQRALEEAKMYSAELEKARASLAALPPVESAALEIAGLDGELGEFRTRLDAARRQLADAGAAAASAHDRHVEVLRRRSVQQNEIIKEESQIEHLRAQLKILEARGAEIARQRAEAEVERAQRAAESTEAKNRLKELLTLKQQRLASLASARTHRGEAEAEALRINNELHSMRSRHQTLEETESRLQSSAVRCLFGDYAKKPENAGGSHPGGLHGVVAELLGAADAHLEAIEAALGFRMQNVVVSSADDAKRAIRYLRDNRFGRATFLPLDRIREHSSVDRRLLSLPGVVGEAYGLARFDAAYARVFGYLLKGILVVEHMDAALAISREHALRIVTLLGDIVSPEGAMTGGGRSAENGTLSRRLEISALEAEIAVREKRAQEIARAFVEEREREERLKRDVQAAEVREQEHTEEARMREQREILAEKEAIRLGQELQLREIERAKLEETLHATEARLTVLKAEVTAAQEAPFVPPSVEELAELEAASARLQEQVRALEIRRVQLEGQVNNVESQRVHLSERLRDYEERLERRDGMVREKNAARDALDEEVRRANVELERMEGDKDGRQAAFFELRRERDELRQRRRGIQEGLDKLIEEIRALDRQVSDVAVADQDLRTRQEGLFNDIYGEFHTDIEDLYYSRRKTGDELFQKEAEFPALVVELKRQVGETVEAMAKLGNINFEAVEELKALEEREKHLVEQKKDLDESWNKLDLVLRDLDKRCNDMFAETFHQVNTHFQVMFARLFGGGQGTLEIEENVDPLEAGITIRATPPGKSPRVLSQLSGGEKVLTTIAFLFSIFLYKPSPFCVLDEIDAPLDEHNVDRFMNAIRGFTDRCQFLIVTHNRRTMSLSDVIHGVTMQEKGVSRCLSVDLDSIEFNDILAQAQKTAVEVPVAAAG